MAGRGAAITVRLLASGEDLLLSCALHTPLYILKQQLFGITQMLPQHQVLVLRHPSNDNLDIQLEGDDEELSLRECGVTNNSLLTLHSLYTGPDTLTRKEEGSAEEGAEMNGMPLYTLTTRLGPKEADHSYNGIIFDVESKAPYEVVVTAVWVAGMLGNVRAFVRDQPWSGHDLRPKARQSMWGNRYIIEKEGWEQVADVQCSPSWDKCREIIFDEPLRLLPGQRRGIYVHSDLPDDLGIQYQTYRTNQPFAGNEHMTLHPGLGHTSCEPFDLDDGWYRGLRGLAGELTYTAVIKRWSIAAHHEFPPAVQQAVQTMLLCHARERNILRTLPQHVVLHILKRVDWCWFENPEREAAEAAALEAAEAAEAAAAQEAAGEASGEGSSARLRTRSRRNTVEVEFW